MKRKNKKYWKRIAKALLSKREEAINAAIERGNIVLKNYRDRYSGLAMQERLSINDHRSFLAEVEEAQRLIDLPL